MIDYSVRSIRLSSSRSEADLIRGKGRRRTRCRDKFDTLATFDLDGGKERRSHRSARTRIDTRSDAELLPAICEVARPSNYRSIVNSSHGNRPDHFTYTLTCVQRAYARARAPFPRPAVTSKNTLGSPPRPAPPRPAPRSRNPGESRGFRDRWQGGEEGGCAAAEIARLSTGRY